MMTFNLVLANIKTFILRYQCYQEYCKFNNLSCITERKKHIIFTLLFKTALKRQEEKSKLGSTAAVAHRKNKEMYWYEGT